MNPTLPNCLVNLVSEGEEHGIDVDTGATHPFSSVASVMPLVALQSSWNGYAKRLLNSAG